MERRACIAALAGLALLATRAVRAQQPRTRRVGVLTSGAASAERKRFDELVEGLAELGYVEGRNLVLERRYADGRFERLPALAAELVGSKVEVIVCMSTLAAQAARDVTRTVPIVFATVADPVGEGFVASLSRPGGNITGISNLGTELTGKQLQVLKEAFPKTSRVAALTAPSAPHAAAQLEELENAARSLGIEILNARLQRREEVETLLARLRASRADALFVMQGAENSAVRTLLVEFAATARLPAVYPQRNYVEAGGLLSYGPDFNANYRRAASYVDRILRGSHPGELPVEQSARFELAINLKTANSLGLELPRALVIRADTVTR